MAAADLTLADIRIDVDGVEFDGDDLARFLLSGGPTDLACALRGLASMIDGRNLSSDEMVFLGRALLALAEQIDGEGDGSSCSVVIKRESANQPTTTK
jgi:hypothetical protein